MIESNSPTLCNPVSWVRGLAVISQTGIIMCKVVFLFKSAQRLPVLALVPGATLRAPYDDNNNNYYYYYHYYHYLYYTTTNNNDNNNTNNNDINNINTTNNHSY